MPLIILGLLVVAGLLAYLYFTRNETEELKSKTVVEKVEPEADAPAKVIDLPTDLEKEKKKRNIKTGK